MLRCYTHRRHLFGALRAAVQKLSDALTSDHHRCVICHQPLYPALTSDHAWGCINTYCTAYQPKIHLAERIRRGDLSRAEIRALLKCQYSLAPTEEGNRARHVEKTLKAPSSSSRLAKQ